MAIIISLWSRWLLARHLQRRVDKFSNRSRFTKPQCIYPFDQVFHSSFAHKALANNSLNFVLLLLPLFLVFHSILLFSRPVQIFITIFLFIIFVFNIIII